MTTPELPPLSDSEGRVLSIGPWLLAAGELLRTAEPEIIVWRYRDGSPAPSPPGEDDWFRDDGSYCAPEGWAYPEAPDSGQDSDPALD